MDGMGQVMEDLEDAAAAMVPDLEDMEVAMAHNTAAMDILLACMAVMAEPAVSATDIPACNKPG